LQDCIEVEDPGLENLFSAEGKQLACECRIAFGGIADLFESFVRRCVPVSSSEQAVGVTLDDGEDVVEVVSNTSGELADGLEFLGMAELGLKAENVGDVGAVTVDDLT